MGIDANNTAAYTKNIFEHPEAFAGDAYWRFDDHIFTGTSGQHLNGMDDVSSVFIPNYVNITDAFNDFSNSVFNEIKGFMLYTDYDMNYTNLTLQNDNLQENNKTLNKSQSS